MIYIALFINIILLVTGQTLWKIGLSNITFSKSIASIIKIFFNPYIFSGLILYVAATLAWFYVLKNGELSKVYPLQSLCYIFSALIALFIFKENISIYRWLGIILIMGGASLIALK